MSLTTHPLCPPKDSYPTVDEFRLGLGEGSAIACYTFSAGVLVFNIVLLIILIIRFIKTVPSRQVPSQIWVISLPTGLAFCQFLMVLLPNASEFLLASFKVYEAVVIYKFVDLNLKWFGGEKKLLDSVGTNPVLRFNLPPLCCFLFCLTKTHLTRKKIQFVRLVVSQMVYIQIFVLFIQQVLNYQKSVSDGLLSASNPNTFLDILGRSSFFAGFWGLFVFFNIDYTFNILEKSGKFKVKFFLMKTPLLLMVVQEIVIEVLVATDSVHCGPYLSTHAMGTIVMSSAIMVESSLIGLFQFMVYYRFPIIESKHMKIVPEIANGEGVRL